MSLCLKAFSIDVTMGGYLGTPSVDCRAPNTLDVDVDAATRRGNDDMDDLCTRSDEHVHGVTLVFGGV